MIHPNIIRVRVSGLITGGFRLGVIYRVGEILADWPYLLRYVADWIPRENKASFGKRASNSR